MSLREDILKNAYVFDEDINNVYNIAKDILDEEVLNEIFGLSRKEKVLKAPKKASGMIRKGLGKGKIVVDKLEQFVTLLEKAIDKHKNAATLRISVRDSIKELRSIQNEIKLAQEKVEKFGPESNRDKELLDDLRKLTDDWKDVYSNVAKKIYHKNAFFKVMKVIAALLLVSSAGLEIRAGIPDNVAIQNIINPDAVHTDSATGVTTVKGKHEQELEASEKLTRAEANSASEYQQRANTQQLGREGGQQDVAGRRREAAASYAGEVSALRNTISALERQMGRYESDAPQILRRLNQLLATKISESSGYAQNQRLMYSDIDRINADIELVQKELQKIAAEETVKADKAAMELISGAITNLTKSQEAFKKIQEDYFDEQGRLAVSADEAAKGSLNQYQQRLAAARAQDEHDRDVRYAIVPLRFIARKLVQIFDGVSMPEKVVEFFSSTVKPVGTRALKSVDTNKKSYFNY